MSNLSPQRKKVVVLGASVACLSAVSSVLKGHEFLHGALLGFMVVVLAYTITQLMKLKRSGL